MSGVRNMRAGITSIGKLNVRMRELPLRIRASVAKDAEAVLTKLMRDEFNAGKTVYDSPRPLGVNGNALTLVKSGKVKNALFFVAIGTILRASLGTKYARYLIGKYKIMPHSLPAAWRAKLEQIVREHEEDFAREMSR